MTSSEMTFAEFSELLQVYGADFSRWPQDRISQAQTLLDASEEARAQFAEFSRIDAVFNQNRDSTPPSGLLDRIMDVTKDKK